MVQEKMTRLIIITGPTAVGKSATAIEAAIRFGGEIVSADSMQIYKGMDIGTGKVTKSEMCSVPHFLLDVVSPDQDYSVGQYVLDAKKAIDDIAARGKTPILVGGTGLYINSLLFNHSFASAPKDDGVRNKLKEFLAINGAEKLYERLKEVDPVSSGQINPNDTKRIIRALEIYELTGKPRGESKDELKPCYDYLFAVITDERQALYDRINNRVDKMVELGLVDEVKSLYKYKDCNSMQAIGYKEIVAYLDSKVSLGEAIEQVKQSSRRYAKRQMTFFRGIRAEKQFFNAGDQGVYALIDNFLN